MTTTVGTETETDLVNHWLNTGGIPVIGHDGSKVYPRRSDLRRAEARATARRGSQGHPPAPVGHRPPVFAGAGRAVGSQVSPRAPRSEAFYRSPATTNPTPEWGLDLTRPQSASSDCAPAPRPGRFPGTATRLLVVALVVGAEGAAVSQFAGPADSDNGPTTATLSLDDLQDSAESERRAAAARQAQLTAEEERANTTAVALESVKEASPAKAEAALDQANKAKATQIRHLKAQAKARSEARAAKAAEAAQAAKAREKAPAPAAKRTAEPAAPPKAAAKPEPKKAKPSAEPSPKAEKKRASTSSRKKALANARKNPRAAARALLRDRGWSSTQYTCLDSLWNRESNWNYRAKNPSSGAYGIPQALPATKMSSAGADWKTNPVTQIRWGLDYIADRYGSPCGAWNHSESHGWY